MAYISNYQYYTNNGVAPTDQNWGEYQYVSLSDVVNNFMMMYVGDDKLVNNVNRYNVLFHAKRGIQEINYDALKNTKVVEIEVGDDLQLILPPDYVNYIRVSVQNQGVLYPLHENTKINYATAYLQDNNLNVLFDQDGNVLTGTSDLDAQRIMGNPQALYNGTGPYAGQYGWYVDGDWYFGYAVGGYFGLNTETANVNPSFRVNKAGGVINFSSGVANQLIVLEYVSDGMENGDDDSVKIHKFAEEFLYSYVKWALLNNKFGIQEYVVNRAKKEKTANLRNAKIRLSNLHPGRLLMNLRGQDKWIK